MARPKKAIVDYFPHSTEHGKTMFIIESRWGNDGYSFWFKLLELLGRKDGHVIDCNNPDDWEALDKPWDCEQCFYKVGDSLRIESDGK